MAICHWPQSMTKAYGQSSKKCHWPWSMTKKLSLTMVNDKKNCHWLKVIYIGIYPSLYIRKISKLLRPTSVNNYQLCLPNVAPVSTSTLELLRCLAWRGQEEVEPCTKEGREEEATSVDFYHWSTPNTATAEHLKTKWNFSSENFLFLAISYEISVVGVLTFSRMLLPLLLVATCSGFSLNALLGGDFFLQQCPLSIFVSLGVMFLSNNVSSQFYF